MKSLSTGAILDSKIAISSVLNMIKTLLSAEIVHAWLDSLLSSNNHDTRSCHPAAEKLHLKKGVTGWLLNLLQ